ncbi:hypothetical protein WA171_006134 [Blastocystis sp. BT1]
MQTDENANLLSGSRKRNRLPQDNSTEPVKKTSKLARNALTDVQNEQLSIDGKESTFSHPVYSDSKSDKTLEDVVSELQFKNQTLQEELSQEKEKSRTLSDYAMECIDSNDKLSEEIQQLKVENADLRNQVVEYVILDTVNDE